MSILIVDDSKTITNSLKYAIETKLSQKVYTAASLKECADLILKHKGQFTLALLDYNLPDAQNGEIIGFIKKFKIPSILLTGSILEKTNDIFKNENLIDYVVKNGSYAIDYTISLVKRFILNEKVEVLVVDDSKTFAAKMEALCNKYNLKTLVAHSGKDALDIVSQRANLKLILVDYMMPNMDGLQFTTELRKKYKKDEIALIALSGTSEKDVVANFLKSGANDFLYKDFTTEEFLARINNNLEVIELFSTTQDKAKKDYMTGMFNKNYFLSEASDILQRAIEKRELLSVFIIEIDQFKVICDSYGHDIGDEAIKLLSTILVNYFNEDSIISRFGSDQFCVLLKNRPYAELTQIFKELQSIVKNKPLELKLENIKHNFTISIGCNIALKDNIEDMLEDADDALFKAQQNGDNGYKINS
ncbi:MAG: diguanylate cyclase [Campylobacterota bacterium]|nr:diguanylate cyclase [Campylobacterota bacterium]